MTVDPGSVVSSGQATRRPVLRLVEENPWRWRIDRSGAMRVPGIVFASRDLLPAVAADRSLEQVVNVAKLPGIVTASFAMPDVHWGYGFPIGGVAATDVEEGGVVSPGGVGFDISCGVRLLLSPLGRDEVAGNLTELMDELERAVPKGIGRGAVWNLTGDGELRRILTGGAVYAVERGHGTARDLERCEDGGMLAGADPDAVSDRALLRGLHQVGSLGSGNHFLEVQAVDQIFDAAVAEAFGLHSGRVCVMIHTGSRGLGHQVCTDHVNRMGTAMARYGIQRRRPSARLCTGSLSGGGDVSGGNGGGRQLRAGQSPAAVGRRPPRLHAGGWHRPPRPAL